MAAESLTSVYRALKQGDLRPIYYLTGDEEVLKDELIADVVARAVDPASRDFNLDQRNAADLDGETLNALIETPPMLAERRVVVIRGLEQWRKNAKVWAVLRDYVTHPAPTTVLILTLGAGEKPDAAIARAAFHVSVDRLPPSRVTRWLAKRAADLGVALEPEAAGHLVAVVGAELGALRTELEKLAAACDAEVTVADVAGLVGVRHGETVHDWIDAAIRRDVPRAVGMIDLLLTQPGVSGVRLVMGLGTALIGVRHARALLDAGTSASRLPRAVFDAIRGARPPQLRDWKTEAATWAEAASHWSGPELDAAIAAAYDADRALKSTTVSDERGLLRTMLLQLATRAAA